MPLPVARLRLLELLLRLAVCGAFVGHGAYGAVLAKPAWFDYFGVVGVSRASVDSAALMTVVGAFEIALGVLALLMPLPPLLLLMAAWKVFTEVLRPAAGEPFWEFVERGSNILAPLALLYVMRLRSRFGEDLSGLEMTYDDQSPGDEYRRRPAGADTRR